MIKYETLKDYHFFTFYLNVDLIALMCAVNYLRMPH